MFYFIQYWESHFFSFSFNFGAKRVRQKTKYKDTEQQKGNFLYFSTSTVSTNFFLLLYIATDYGIIIFQQLEGIRISQVPPSIYFQTRKLSLREVKGMVYLVTVLQSGPGLRSQDSWCSALSKRVPFPKISTLQLLSCQL